MSPLERWKNHFALEDVRLPVDADELHLICCDCTFRTISHIGIELCNCVFNSHDLQLLRRLFPTDQSVKIQVKYNSELLNCIWLKNPFTQEYLQVINTDPATKDLNSAQTAKMEELRRQALTTEQLLSRAEARERLIAQTAPLLGAKTQNQRRRAFKLLGLLKEEALEKLPVNPQNKAAAKRQRLKDGPGKIADAPSNPPAATPPARQTVLLRKTQDEDLPPIFAIVKRQRSGPDSESTRGEQS